MAGGAEASSEGGTSSDEPPSSGTQVPAWIFSTCVILLVTAGGAAGVQIDQPGVATIHKTTFLGYQFPNNQSQGRSEPSVVEVGVELRSGWKSQPVLELGLASDSGCQSVMSTTWLTTKPGAEGGMGRAIRARLPLHGIILGELTGIRRTQAGWAMSVCLRSPGGRWQAHSEVHLPQHPGSQQHLHHLLRDGSALKGQQPGGTIYFVCKIFPTFPLTCTTSF